MLLLMSHDDLRVFLMQDNPKWLPTLKIGGLRLKEKTRDKIEKKKIDKKI